MKISIQNSPVKLWQPTEDDLKNSRLLAFIDYANKTYGQTISDFQALHHWSIDSLADFWQACAHFFEVPFHTPSTQVLVAGQHMTESQWFVGATLNYSEALLRKRDDTPAIISIDEEGQTQTLTFNALYDEVRALHFFMRHHGIQPDDVICACLPNGKEAIVGFLAAASIGAIWTSCSPDFGHPAINDRFAQVKPTMLITCNAYRYKGQIFSMREKVSAVLQQIPSIRCVLDIPFVSPELTSADKPLSTMKPINNEQWLSYPDTLANWQRRSANQPIDFVALPFDHPLYILYSSGTTGLPKCIIHRAGGCLLKHLSELGLHLDLKENERLLFSTTCGWMMWNWQVSALALGVTLVLYDGAPFYPQPGRLLEILSTHQVNAFGAGAAYYAHLKNQSISAQMLEQSHLNIRSLRLLLATASPLTGELFDYLMTTLCGWRHGAPQLQIASISGGTDIVGCFILGCIMLPVYRGEIQAQALGVDVDVFNTDHQPVCGEKGELVCKQPFPSMPLAFYGDNDAHSKYKQAYFHTLDNVWFHGDFAEINERGGIIIYGRSDTLLNPGGVRIGTAEIYKHLEAIDDIIEAAAVTLEKSDNIRIILFVVLRPQRLLDEALIQRINKTLKVQASPKHVPAKIISISDLPRTVNGKISEKAIKCVIHDQPVSNVNSLINPESLALFSDLQDQLETIA